jgi:nucleoside-diphosphate-sugar epimerase
MKILITGGGGFIGSRLTKSLLERGSLGGQSISRITLLDGAFPVAPPKDPRLEAVTGDVADAETLARVASADTAAVFHLAAVVSGAAEADFDLGMRVNLKGIELLLERLRRCSRPPRVVFASSVAAFGGALPEVLDDATTPTPQTSYGTQKVVSEYLVADYSRKGFIDGRSLRLPTIVVRAGKPNAAASSFASGIIREPLSGVDAPCPVAPTTRMWVQSPRAVVGNLLVGHEAPATAFSHTRSINVPGINVGVGEMVDALRRVAGDQVAARVKWNYDPVIDRIVSTWPANFAPKLGPSLGMRADADFDGIIRAYIADELPRRG